MLTSKFMASSLAFTHNTQVRLLLVRLHGICYEAAEFTLCYNLLICSPDLTPVLYHRASTLGFLHQLPDSY